MLGALVLSAGALADVKETLVFEDLDSDGDDRLSSIEASRIEGFDFAKADLDRDGFVNEREFERAVRRTIFADAAAAGEFPPLAKPTRSSTAGRNSACCKAYSG